MTLLNHRKQLTMNENRLISSSLEDYLEAIADLIELTEVSELLADADLNTMVNIKDATAIQKHIAGIETGYPIGEPI